MHNVILNRVIFPLWLIAGLDGAGPCRSFAPTFDQAIKKLEPTARFAKLDTENEQRLAARFQIRSIPTILVIKNGKEVARQAGVMTLSQLEQWLKPYIA